MDEERRGNILTQPRSHSLEFAVHGKWRRSESDDNGVYGCWFCDVPELVRTFGGTVVRAKLAEYAAAQATAREEAVAAAEEAIAAAAEAAEAAEEAATVE
jgi:hypothetical protein